MAYQEKKTTGYGTRVGNSLKSVLFGIVLIIGATVLLWWNEGRAVKTADMLEEAQEACVEMPKPDKIDKNLDGELVCGTAITATDATLEDKEFGISENAISLTRTVEYFQWVEHSESKSEDKLGGSEETTTTYTYEKQWVSKPENSGSFKDPQYQNVNYVLANYEDFDVTAENVSFGAYTLNESLISMITAYEAIELNIPNAQLESINKSVGDSYAAAKGQPLPSQTQNQPAAQPAVADSTDATVADSLKTVIPDSISQENKKDYPFVHQAGNVLYLGRNINNPEIGDVRITFNKITPEQKVTIVSVVDGNTFKPFVAKNKKKFQTLVSGKKSIEEIFDAENEENSMWTWILRILGTILVISGVKGLFSFFQTILKVVPFLANIFGFGVSIVSTVIGLVWSLIVIALAWIFYRPILGIILLVIAGFLIWVFAFGGKNKLKSMANRGQEAPAAEQK